MVRTIDASARRELLADAVWMLIREGGLEAASVRGVAAQAGLSTGSVRHFFSTQDELHVFAMEELNRRIAARVKATLADHADADPRDGDQVRRYVLAGMTEVLPTTADSAADFHAHLQFTVKAVVHPPLRATARQSLAVLHDFYRRCVEHLVQAGAARDDLDVEHTTQELASIADGLVLRRLTSPELLGVEEMNRVLAHYLAGLAPELGDSPADSTAD